MDKDLRASLVAAGAATALSALVGVIAGVGFLTLVARALLGGLALGATTYGVLFLLRATVPGILSPADPAAESETSAGEDALRGTNVDIVLPGEAVSPESFLGADASPRYFADPAIAKESGASALAQESGLGEDEASDLSPVDDASLLEPEELVGGSAAAIPSGAGFERDRRPSPGFEDLDVLPDLEGFSDSFTASEFSSGGSSSESGPKGRGSQAGSTARPGQEGLDPASLAKAVRTILKRDQKG